MVVFHLGLLKYNNDITDIWLSIWMRSREVATNYSRFLASVTDHDKFEGVYYRAKDHLESNVSCGFAPAFAMIIQTQ